MKGTNIQILNSTSSISKDKEKQFSAENWVSQIHPLALYFTNEYGSEVAIFKI